jgi:sigma-E factor negative regulatory protein RseC
MVIEEGVIEKTSHGKAVIRIRKSAACATCGSRDTCEVVSDKEMLIEVANDLQAKLGDHVEISMPSSSLLKLSLLVYFLPVVALVVGACLGAAWAQSFHVQTTLASIFGGGFAMAIVFCVLKWLDRVIRPKGEYQPRITRILYSAGSSSSKRSNSYL